MSTTDESFPSNIHGLEVVPDEKDLPRPSSDFDDSIEKKKKKTTNIGGLDIDTNDEDEEEGPPPLELHSMIVWKKREGRLVLYKKNMMP